MSHSIIMLICVECIADYITEAPGEKITSALINERSIIDGTVYRCARHIRRKDSGLNTPYIYVSIIHTILQSDAEDFMD